MRDRTLEDEGKASQILRFGQGSGVSITIHILHLFIELTFIIITIFFFYIRGEVMNGGFGLVLDGSEDSHYRATLLLNWDVSNGVARRYI